MKTGRKTILILLVVMLATVAAQADWDEGDTHKMHFPQLPDPNGWDIKFGPFQHDTAPEGIKILADDWQCSETGPVNDVHFWFSSKGDAFNADTAGISNLHLSIWSNDPGDPSNNVPSRPKDILWWGNSDESAFGQITVRNDGTGQQAWYDPNLPFDPGFNPIPDDHQQIWQVNVTQIVEPFQQQRGEVYWLAIYIETQPRPGEPNNSVDSIEVGWKTADTNRYPDQYAGQHFMDDAFYGHFIDDPAIPVVEWIAPLEDLTLPDAPRSIDLAFVITPEPATLALLVFSGIVLIKRRR